MTVNLTKPVSLTKRTVPNADTIVRSSRVGLALAGRVRAAYLGRK